MYGLSAVNRGNKRGEECAKKKITNMANGGHNSPAAPINQDYSQGHMGRNNFSIGNDFSAMKENMKSVFKKDFPKHEHYGRADIAQPPRLGDVMHVDERFSERSSETVKSFEYRPLPKPVLMGVANKLSYTNFKMDSDTSKVSTFHTTHNHYFTPKMGHVFYPLKQMNTTQMCNIQQGDREKAELPISDYKYKFSDIDTNKDKVEKAKCLHDEGQSTIQGDKRLSHFTSMARTQFQGGWAPKVATIPVPPSYNVPIGDPDKEKTKLSVTQSSFDDYTEHIKSCELFDIRGVSDKLRRTNYKERVGHGIWDKYETTGASAFSGKTVDLFRSSPSKHRNASDIPEGDREAIREQERMSLTTSRFHHGNPATGLHNIIVSGANKRTKSNVCFGDPTLDKIYYSTSTRDVFEPKRVSCTYNRQNHHTPSSIPLNYYGNRMTYEPTTSTDYTNPKQERMLLNPKAMKSLQGSHISTPQKHMTFDTTHCDQYTPKQLQNHFYDSGSLQKSSVPLGTMTV